MPKIKPEDIPDVVVEAAWESTAFRAGKTFYDCRRDLAHALNAWPGMMVWVPREAPAYDTIILPVNHKI